VRGGNALAAHVGRRLSSVLHVNDDAGLASGLYTAAFDDRGVPPIPVPILREGRVGSLYYDVEEARREGLRPTGHVRDGAVRPSNLIVRPGARTRNVILTELKHWVAPDRLPPLDLQSGRFVGDVPFLVVEDGERRGASTARVDLGIEQVLAAVEEVAADQERTCEVDAPTMVLAPLPHE
jgi:predicted Zn-dependent protease